MVMEMYVSKYQVHVNVHNILFKYRSIIYHIAENFGEIFNLANWRFSAKLPNLKPINKLLFHTLSLYVEVLAIAKFKIHQCIPMTDSPNLMLAKVSCYTVYHRLMKEGPLWTVCPSPSLP